jgi:hypothetical protein
MLEMHLRNEPSFGFQLVQQQDGICEPPRESKRNAGRFSINTRLQPRAKAQQNQSRFNGFPAEKKLLKQFFVSVAACTGLEPGVTGKQPVNQSISLPTDSQFASLTGE